MSAECSAENIPPGYKQTEVGVIPEDWKVKPLNQISPKQCVGLVINPSSYFDDNGTVPILVGSNIKKNGINWESAKCITNASNKMIASSQLAAGDLVTVRVGEPGITAVVPPELDSCNCASMMIVRQHHSFNSRWLCYIMNSQIGLSQVEHVQYGTAQKQFNISDAINFSYPVPPFAEQEAIAEALSDADAFIESLEQLVNKKRQIKQGAMQELLTGKRRLPGFETKRGYKQTEVGLIPEDWEIKQLGNIATIATGNTPPTRDPANYGDEFMFVSPVDLGFSKHISHTEKMLSKKGFSISRPFPTGSVLFVCIGSTIGKCGIALEILTSNQQINAILPSEGMSCDYLYYAVSSVAPKVKSLAGEQAVPIVNKTQFSETTIPLPSTITEQKAIATILSDMDSEITTLEKKLAKARQLKQGMMQELLTGRIRLI